MAKVPPFYFPTVQFCSLPEGSTTDDGEERRRERGRPDNQWSTARDCTLLRLPRISKREQHWEWDRTHRRLVHRLERDAATSL